MLAAGVSAWAGGIVVVAPARINLIQAGLDLAARHDVILVSYRGKASTPKPLIHVWNGKTWDFVPIEAFLSGSFLRAKPEQTIVIGDEKMLPEVFAPMTAWAGKLQKVPSIFTPDILNAAGTALRFRRAEWQWFAKRYSMKVETAPADASPGSSVGRSLDAARPPGSEGAAPEAVPPAFIKDKESIQPSVGTPADPRP